MGSGGRESWAGAARGGLGTAGGTDGRGGAVANNAAGAGDDGAADARDTSASAALVEVPAGSSDEMLATGGRDVRGDAGEGGRGGVFENAAYVYGVSGTQAGGADGARTSDVNGMEAGGIHGTIAEGVDDDGAIYVGDSGVGAHRERSRNAAADVGRAGAGVVPGRRATDGSSARERCGRRDRDAEKFTQEELKTFFLEELRVTLGLSARQAFGMSAVRMQGRFIHGAQVMVLTELMDPLTVWTEFVDGMVLAFCSCGRVMAAGQTAAADDIEPVDLQVALRESSTCRHAVALLEAYDALCVDMRAGTLDELMRSCPALLGSEEGAPVGEDDTVVLFAMRSGKRNNIPIYVFHHMGIWSPAVVWQQGNRHRLTTCCLLSCMTQPWACIHAKAVNHDARADRTSSSQAVLDNVDAMRLGADGILEDDEDDGVRGAAPPEAATSASAAAALEASMRPRRARNMFPCVKEVEMCDRHAAFVEEERESPGEVHFTDLLHVEDECFACDDRWTESTA